MISIADATDVALLVTVAFVDVDCAVFFMFFDNPLPITIGLDKTPPILN